MNKGTILTHIENKVATITFFHVASNSFPRDLLDKLVETINRLNDNDAVHIIVLQSEGDKAFCAGASFDELLAVKTLDEGKHFFSGFANLINAMRTCSKILIGRVQGKAVGGGVGIIAATDYCFATEAADIKLSELNIGIGPFVISPALERKIGISALSELSLDATHWQTAYWAQKKGLFARVFENSKDMDKAVEDLSEKLAGYNPKTLAEWKKTLWNNTDHWGELLYEYAEKSGAFVLSNDTKKALEKFKK